MYPAASIPSNSAARCAELRAAGLPLDTPEIPRELSRAPAWLVPDLTKFKLDWPPYWQCVRCGCTNDGCAGCVARTGEPCWWVTPYRCSACVMQ